MARIKVFDTNTQSWVYADKPFGKNGINGKSAYEYAKDGGYTGTEAEFATKLATEKPILEFINDISECTDTSKMYVLPTGEVCAYMLDIPYTNVLKSATTEPNSTEIYNGKGWKENTRIGSSGTFYDNYEGMCTSGYIPVKYNDVIRIKNITFEGSAAPYFVYYKGSGNEVTWTTVRGLTEADSNEQGIITITVNGTAQTFLRLSVGNIDDTSIITINEEITDTEAFIWKKTGYFLNSEKYNNSINNRLSNIEEIISENGSSDSGSTDSIYIPKGVKDSVSDVVDRVLSREDNKIIRFLAISDAHHTDNTPSIAASTKELGQAVDEVLREIGVDFVINLGDMTWGSSNNTQADCLEEGKSFNSLVASGLRGQTQIWLEGNHETGILTKPQIYTLFTSRNKEISQNMDTWDNGYGYIDFPKQKVRIICLNTTEKSNFSGITNTQLEWFAKTALNMEGKTDWTILSMGHHPIGYDDVSLFRYCAIFLKEYMSETPNPEFEFTTNDQYTIKVDYTNKRGKYVGHFHGHAHTYTMRKIRKYVSQNVQEELEAYDICIPNACATRTDQYNQHTEDEYLKTYFSIGGIDYIRPQVDGQRTAFTVVTVCLDKEIIYADDYGITPPVDRYVYYGEEEKATYSVTNTLTNVVNSNSNVNILEGSSYTAILVAADGYTMDGANVMITMDGVDVSSSYENGVINIASVTGNIVITASAVIVPTNLLDISQRTYTPMTEPTWVELSEPHEIDFNKCYAAHYDGRRGQYPSSKITYTPNIDTNGFTFTSTSSSGYGVEFPVNVQSDKNYKLIATSVEVFPNVYLFKFNADKTIKETTKILSGWNGSHTRDFTFTPESGYLYSIMFVVSSNTVQPHLKDISLMEII